MIPEGHVDAVIGPTLITSAAAVAPLANAAAGPMITMTLYEYDATQFMQRYVERFRAGNASIRSPDAIRARTGRRTGAEPSGAADLPAVQIGPNCV
jgi:hypothetical protein